MPDPISVASLALTLSTKATEAMNALRERSQRTKDLDIKDQISTLYDIVLELKEIISRVSDENKDLKQQLETQKHPPEEPELKQVGDAHYYYLKGGTDGPYCQSCYVVNKRLVKLPQGDHWNGGLRRDCPVCHGTFWDRRMRI
jgi:hypothetical protein